MDAHANAERVAEKFRSLPQDRDGEEFDVAVVDDRVHVRSREDEINGWEDWSAPNYYRGWRAENDQRWALWAVWYLDQNSNRYYQRQHLLRSPVLDADELKHLWPTLNASDRALALLNPNLPETIAAPALRKMLGKVNLVDDFSSNLIQALQMHGHLLVEDADRTQLLGIWETATASAASAKSHCAAVGAMLSVAAFSDDDRGRLKGVHTWPADDIANVLPHVPATSDARTTLERRLARDVRESVQLAMARHAVDAAALGVFLRQEPLGPRDGYLPVTNSRVGMELSSRVGSLPTETLPIVLPHLAKEHRAIQSKGLTATTTTHLSSIVMVVSTIDTDENTRQWADMAYAVVLDHPACDDSIARMVRELPHGAFTAHALRSHDKRIGVNPEDEVEVRMPRWRYQAMQNALRLAAHSTPTGGIDTGIGDDFNQRAIAAAYRSLMPGSAPQVTVDEVTVSEPRVDGLAALMEF